jgi:hypothetical protein
MGQFEMIDFNTLLFSTLHIIFESPSRFCLTEKCSAKLAQNFFILVLKLLRNIGMV